jgi:hypothetical protein
MHAFQILGTKCIKHMVQVLVPKIIIGSSNRDGTDGKSPQVQLIIGDDGFIKVIQAIDEYTFVAALSKGSGIVGTIIATKPRDFTWYVR